MYNGMLYDYSLGLMSKRYDAYGEIFISFLMDVPISIHLTAAVLPTVSKKCLETCGFHRSKENISLLCRRAD